MPIAVTLVSKPGCHLCDEARDVVARVLAEVALEASTPVINFEERSIFDDAELLDRFAEEIPVVLINGRVHNIYRVDPVRLRAALLEV
jgi:hypothetical protein